MKQFIALKCRRILIVLKNRRLFWHSWHYPGGEKVLPISLPLLFCKSKSIGNTDTDRPTAKLSPIQYRYRQQFWY